LYTKSKLLKKLANIRIDDEHDEKEDGRSDTDMASENKSEIIIENRNKNEMELDSIEYLAGWVAKNYRSTMPEIGCTTTEFNKTITGHAI